MDVTRRAPTYRASTHRATVRALVTDRRVDALAVLVCLALTPLAVKTPWSSLPLPVIAVAGVLGSVAQWPRRRWPQVAATVGAAAYVLSGNPGPLLVGLYSAGSYAPRRQLWALALTGWAGFAAWSWIDAGQLYVADLVYGVLFIALVVAVGVYMATRTALVASLRERAERAEVERQLRDQQARASERTRIAREMHDVLAHKVSLIALHAGGLELTSDSPAKVRQGAALIRVTAREAMQELRLVLGVLNAEAEPPAGTRISPDEPFPDLASLVRASTLAGQRVELRDRAGPLPPITTRVVHRIVQEGLTNARKHAPDATATVSVDRGEGGDVTVTVHNAAGAGAPMDLPGSGSGLVGLAERIRLVGGCMRTGPLGTEGGDGWQLSAVIPGHDQPVEELPVDADPVASLVDGTP